MIRNHSRRIVNRKNEELVTDPHELLLSLVDMGSLDTDEALLACVSEMSDAECKRVLSSLSLPSCCDDAEDDEMPVEVDDDDADTDMEVEFPSDDEFDDDNESEEAELDEDDDKSDDDEEAELEARIRRLERYISNESHRRFSCR